MKKITIAAGLISMAVIVSGCSSSDEAKADEAKQIESGFKAEHLHGIAYGEDQNIYIATHEGMLSTGSSGEKWEMKGDYDFDFMGFHVLSDGTMLTSGHPGEKSDLPNPLGILESTNNGEKWESKSMLGKVDFHIISSNFSKPNVIYAVNQMDSGNYKAGLYKSTDKGKKWESLEASGLPKDLHQIYSIVSMPDDENVLLAGSADPEIGVIQSLDGGKTWETYEPFRLITAFGVLPESKELVSYSITEGEAGVTISKDQGKTWEYKGLDLGQDAVAYFGVNPKDSSKIAISTFENTVLVTEDGGENWNAIMVQGTVN